MDPRISFSNFVDAKLAIKNEKNNIYREAPVSSSDFEFSVKNYSMISADEVFFKGMLLPQQCSNKKMVNDEYDEGNKVVATRIPKTASSRWKERLGLTGRGASKKDKNKNSSHGDHNPVTCLINIDSLSLIITLSIMIYIYMHTKIHY
ncbi:hypothetical protein Ahy_A10g049256 isoform A [Arachis hypogaea]|uniref:Uncharacterized protein n=1 Tax=Arachis hypogaea TaxID=3818 RepID=A0A445B6T2_ARAHY|nr:hypothetical protein Ahy_A10g049256 isoform A [Arachis hypogaea]